MKLVFSLVIYKHSLEYLKPLFNSISALSSTSPFNIHLLIHDNSPTPFHADPIKDYLYQFSSFSFVYITSGSNIGFGRGHNHNLYSFSKTLSDDDLLIIVNPDISFLPDQVQLLVEWFSGRLNSFACVAPLILLPNGTIQYSAKKNPSLLHLLVSRVSSLRIIPFLSNSFKSYVNSSRDYRSELIHSSYLSGCFLLLRTSTFFAVGGFTHSFFLHLEDADFVRKCSSILPCVHYPYSYVTHLWARGSHNSMKQMLYIAHSFILYSRIWGFALF